MHIELTADEAKNVQICLVRVAKLGDVPAPEMAYLLNLTNKFAEQPKSEVIPEITQEVEEVKE